MRMHHLFATGAVALVLSPLSFAATNPASTTGADKTARCTKLQSEYDQKASTTTTAKSSKAQAMRDEGAKLCMQGKTEEGAKELQKAIRLIGGGNTK